MPKISVILTTYNRSNHVNEALESVSNQDYSNFEILIIDDGSIDNTYKTLKIKDVRIRYIYQKNSGISSARNLGIILSKGEYIAFMDSDDLWHRSKLSCQLKTFQDNPDININFTGECWIRNDSFVNKPKEYIPSTDNIVERLLNRCFIGASSVMIKKNIFDCVGLFNESLTVCEDLDLWLRIAMQFQFSFLDKPLTIKRMGDWEQLSTTTLGMDKYRVLVFESLLSNRKLSKIHNRQLTYAAMQKSAILTRGYFRHRRFNTAIRYALKTLRHSLSRYVI